MSLFELTGIVELTTDAAIELGIELAVDALVASNPELFLIRAPLRRFLTRRAISEYHQLREKTRPVVKKLQAHITQHTAAKEPDGRTVKFAGGRVVHFRAGATRRAHRALHKHLRRKHKV